MNNRVGKSRKRVADFETIPEAKRAIQNWPPKVVNRVTKSIQEGLLEFRPTRFLRGTVDLDDETKVDSSWRVKRFLGRGGFGTVGLWERKDAEGNVIDEVVVKEEKPHSYIRGLKRCDATGEYVHDSEISMEAFILKLLNANGNENILRLRQFICIKGHRAGMISGAGRWEQKLWRSYLEHAPHGDLENLRNRYRAFHRYLPEGFIWHVFHSLARAIREFEFSQSVLDGVESEYILHLDLKPANVLLGYELPHVSGQLGGIEDSSLLEIQQKPVYPSVKLADFGLSKFSSLTQGGASTAVHDRGTHVYHPLEQLRKHQSQSGREDTNHYYGKCWVHPPYGLQSSGDKPPHPTTKMNVWGVGKVICDLASLSHETDYENAVADVNEQRYISYNNSALADFDKVPFAQDRLRQKTPYSKELTNLIQRCMSIDPSLRPTSDELVDTTLANLRQNGLGNPSTDVVSVRHPELYYVGNEINSMPIELRNCDLDVDAHDFLRIIKAGRVDPELPPLRLYPEMILGE